MTAPDRVIVKVPASTANLGPGFDTLGMALELYAYIEMSRAEVTQIELYGNEMQGIPTDKRNLIYKVAQIVFDDAGVSVPELHISMYSDIPLTRGLGSSASAIVGGMVAANALIGNILSKERIFTLATELERHPDNVGASLYGGIIVATWDGETARHIRLEPHADLTTLVAIPEFQLATEKARHVLPASITMGDAVFNVSHSSLLVAAFASGEFEMIRHTMKDRMHQPYRASLIPGMTEILEKATDNGALGVALSGAGPTLIALVDRKHEKEIQLEQFLLETLKHEQITATTMRLAPCTEGAVVLQATQGQSFMDVIKGEM
ncbi:homoserine kinase [Paenibacillus selenitireducens]|uniref:Homoserine kinase n=1 Tax=Paenibacillus selenitireducens TaxID=1324314 RepID=A0A1T2XKH0_9BACL|nr:homoserine kinase [Paenibacillus selenitireducens]OPA80361.1 homoserine kinase [Paenibacillus selenitireducens]